MESWPGQEKRVQMVLAALRQVWENRRPVEEPERLAMSLLLAWRSGRQALVSFAPGQPLSIPLPD